jgi:hypothetical protein
MKKLLPFITMITLIAIVIVACKDNFNESDFLKLQSTLKTQQDTSKLNQQIKALNDAGKLLSLTIQVVDDRNPLAGVDVTISNNVTSGTVKVTTDANGNAVFPNVTVGVNTVILSKTGYAPATAVLDFGSVAVNTYYTTTTGANGVTNVVPLPQSRSAILPLYTNGGAGSFATITGKVTIENDLTTPTLEVPQNLTILANLNNLAVNTSTATGTGLTIVSYTFNQAGLGTGAVDKTTGVFTMKVPATSVGLAINLIVPNITGTKKMAVNGINGVPFAVPQYFDVPTVWGPTATGLTTNIPAIPGAMAVFANPPAAGSGLDKAYIFSATGYSRNLQFTNQSFTSQSTTFTTGNATYQFDRGTGNFSSSPIVSLSGGGATTQGQLKTTLSGVFSNFSSIVAGTGYTGNITLTFQYTNGAGAIVKIADYIFANVTGSLPLTTTIDPTSPNFNLIGTTAYGSTTFNGDNTANFTTATDVLSFSVVSSGTGGTTSAGATPIFSSQVAGIFVPIVAGQAAQGSGYTSAPTISAFTGGGSPAALPILKVLDFGFQWPFTFDNTKITSAYSVLPQNIQLNVASSAAYPISNTLSTNITDQSGATSSLLGSLTISGTTVSLNDASGGVLALRTSLYSASAPAVVITDITPSVAKMTTLTISLPTASPAGAITAVTGITAGVGYNTIYGVSIQPTVAGAPGSGATVLLSGFTHGASGAQTWGGTTTITNQGSGYLQNLNIPVGSATFAISQSNPLTVQTGQTYTVNIDYGTGTHQIKVQ